ncbi:MAG TPA: M6 family metalloprotease domain-containing protein [Acidimicrobiales bacterium]|jgi:immune inhibitor A
MTHGHDLDAPCFVAPSPELRERLRATLGTLRTAAGAAGVGPQMLTVRGPISPGLNDGLIYPGTHLPAGTPLALARRQAADRAPLRDAVKVIVVLVDFDDAPMANDKAHYEELFFSTGTRPNGSVNDYFREVSGGLLSIEGEVAGPYRLPRPVSEYANGAAGTGGAAPNARTMAEDAASAADADVDFAPYDNDGNGFVDAFIVVHAGQGAESTASNDDIWSHKWVLASGELPVDGAKIYAYLTVPEDCGIGVCCHELGHLLFGWPDLYDIDYSSNGVGSWCLMGDGSWNGSGDVPAHPSAWCKVSQDWVTVVNHTANEKVDVDAVQSSRTVHRLWKDGADGQEYFLVENRQRTGYDRELPSDGLLIWHVDDSIEGNADESHYRVALVQADDRRDLERGANQGDDGDPFPGSGGITAFTTTSSPSSRSYAGLATCVAVTDIGASAASISTSMAVTCPTLPAVTEPTVRKGSRGPAVEKLQRLLGQAGFDAGTVDGVFGTNTVKAVRAFQKANGLVVDGVAGRATWAALLAATAT